MILLSASFKIVVCITNLFTKVASPLTSVVMKCKKGRREDLPYANISQGFVI